MSITSEIMIAFDVITNIEPWTEVESMYRIDGILFVKTESRYHIWNDTFDNVQHVIETLQRKLTTDFPESYFLLKISGAGFKFIQIQVNQWCRRDQLTWMEYITGKLTPPSRKIMDTIGKYSRDIFYLGGNTFGLLHPLPINVFERLFNDHECIVLFDHQRSDGLTSIRIKFKENA
jgi:hypothetical protein